MPPRTPPGVALTIAPNFGHEAEQDRDQRRDVVGGRGVDPGRAHDADVLGVRRGRRATERAGEGGRDAVGTDGAAHVGVEVLAGHLGDGLDVAGVLRDERDDAGQDEQDRGERERRAVDDRDAVGERAARQADPVGGLDAGPRDAVVLGRLGGAAEDGGDRDRRSRSATQDSR